MRRLAALLALAALAACGADGPPVKPGLTIEGEAQIGIVTG